jgi:hypothetical protein
MHEKMLRTPASGNADLDFLAQMIPHHQGAVDMARLYLISGNDPFVRRLAEEIIAGQQAEITAMQARLDILRKGPDPSPGDFPSLGGTRERLLAIHSHDHRDVRAGSAQISNSSGSHGLAM